MAFYCRTRKCNDGSFLDGCSMIIMEHCGGASIQFGAVHSAPLVKQRGEKRELTVKEFAEILQADCKASNLSVKDRSAEEQ